MKSFKEYLTESTKTYQFKVKIAGDYEKAAESIKSALSAFKVESCSAGKRLPIAETHADFPNHKNINVTLFDVTTSYPANSTQVRSAISDKLGCSQECVRVRTPMEEAEIELNHQHDTKADGALLGKDYEASNNQKVVGEKQKFNLLKELNKVKHQGTEVKGTNEALLASSAPKGSQAEDASKINTKSTVGSTKIKKPTAKTVGAR